MSCLDLFPQLEHPVLGQRWIDLPEVKVRVVPITPTHEAADFASATVTGLLAAGAAAATGSQCTKWQQVARWRYELSHPPMDEATFWEPTDEFLNQADYDLKLLVKTWKDEYGADDYACSMVLRSIADSVYLPEGQPLV